MDAIKFPATVHAYAGRLAPIEDRIASLRGRIAAVKAIEDDLARRGQPPAFSSWRREMVEELQRLERYSRGERGQQGA